MTLRHITGVLMIFSLALTGCDKPHPTSRRPAAAVVQAELDKLAPVTLDCDLSPLSAADRAALVEIIRAAQVIDRLFLLQVDPDNPAVLKQLEADPSPENQPYVQMFRVMFGPWNRLDHDRPWLTERPKPQGAGFYPPDMTREEFEAWISAHPEQRSALESTFTVIRRDEKGFKAIPYHEYYQPLVAEAAGHLEKAAALTDDPTLARFLGLRARDLRRDDYFESDMAWMDLAGDLEVVIGPYEVYEDALFNFKAAYEAFVCVVDQAESQKLAAIAAHLNEMEARLPIPDQYKNFGRGSSSPIKVVQELFSGGDTKAGVQTTAFNLPNDERVREAKGSKKVMLKNIARAKYEKCWIPIVNTVLAPRPLAAVEFDSYFNHVLMHEVSHGLGPGLITLANGEKIDVARRMKELSSVMEECKADVLGVITMRQMMEKGIFPLAQEYSMYASYLGGMLRSIRFGINEAHGGGVAIQFNYGFDKGAFFLDSSGKLDLDESKVLPMLTDLAQKVLMFQATGDYEGAKEFVARYRVMTPAMQQMVDALREVPIDIRASYPSLAELGIEQPQ